MRNHILVAVTILASCGQPAAPKDPAIIIDDSDDQMSASNNTDEDTPSTAQEVESTHPEGGVRIADVALSATTLSPGEPITISVQVAHPEGYDAVGGGRLITASGAVLGNFAGTAGAFQYLLSWESLNLAEPITFGSATPATFAVMFYDNELRETVEAITVELSCGGDSACDGACGSMACDGACFTEFATDDRCGACGNVCNGDERCRGGTCEPAVNHLAGCEDDTQCFPGAQCRYYPDEEDIRRCVTPCPDFECATGSCLIGRGAAVCATPCSAGCGTDTVCDPEVDVCVPAF